VQTNTLVILSVERDQIFGDLTFDPFILHNSVGGKLELTGTHSNSKMKYGHDFVFINISS